MYTALSPFLISRSISPPLLSHTVNMLDASTAALRTIFAYLIILECVMHSVPVSLSSDLSLTVFPLGPDLSLSVSACMSCFMHGLCPLKLLTGTSSQAVRVYTDAP